MFSVRGFSFGSLGILLAILWAGLGRVAAGAEEEAPVSEAKAITTAAKPLRAIYLRTEFLPYEKTVEQGIPHRLGREIVRQAFLVAIRDELGVPAYDETLGETPPKDAAAVELMLTERIDMRGKCRVKLLRYAADVDIQEAEPLWEKTYTYKRGGRWIYWSMIPQLEADSRDGFLESLAAAGFERQASVRDQADQKPAENEPAAEIEAALNKIDFIAQFGAVRAAHQAIAERGETEAWLDVLVRGYANLAMLTKHQWNAMTEVFTARAWLYAQRMVAAAKEQDQSQQRLALWHRAYAWALGGTLHHALADLKTLDEQPAKEEDVEEEDAEQEDAPGWAALLSPYCHWQRDKLKETGVKNEALKPWATRLSFQLIGAYRQPQWMYQAGGEVARAAPTAYGVYAELANHGGSLEATRTGAYWAPAAFGHYAPQSLSDLPDMPDSIREFLPTSALKLKLLQMFFQDPEPDDYFSAAMPFIANKLRELPPGKTPGAGLSWSALAYLLDEEQFVEVANYFDVSTNATERSLADEVDAVLPLIENHRYASYVDSYRYNRRLAQDELLASMEGVEWRDPRMSMYAFFARAWNTKHPKYQRLGAYGYRHSMRNYTLPGTLETVYRNGPNWQPKDEGFAKMQAREFNAIVPGSEVGVRMEIQATLKPTLEQMKAWESQLVEDPTAWMTLGHRYYQAQEMESCERCYQKSLDAMPTLQAATSLANLKWQLKDPAGWEKTLVDFIENTEDVGLSHAVARWKLAGGLMHQGRWQDAKPPAVKAAETYAYSGLYAASSACEGLADWQDSEHWIRAVSENYFSSGGYLWYFWCRRTGRGELFAAEELAEKFFAVPIRRPTRDNYVMRGVYNLLRQDEELALENYQRALAVRPSFTCTFMIVNLARGLDQPELVNKMIAAMRDASGKRQPESEEDAAVNEAGRAILTMMEAEEANEELLTKAEQALKKCSQVDCSAFCYFLGCELERLGEQAEAEKFWRISLILPGRDTNYSTLSGVKLAEYNDTSRPDGEELTRADLWPAPEESVAEESAPEKPAVEQE